MFKCMVSFRYIGSLHHGMCGNTTGTLEEVKSYAIWHRHGWLSHSFFRYTPNPSGISDLEEIDQNGNPIPFLPRGRIEPEEKT